MMPERKASESRTVYSTDHGRMCPTCGKPVTACDCRKQPPQGRLPAGDGIVRIGRETKGRKGKGVTVIHGLPLRGEALRQLVTQLKQLCGSGGTVKDGVIEIQGDHRDKLVEVLTQRGYTVKRSGG
jgi:translation initiation factor 1